MRAWSYGYDAAGNRTGKRVNNNDTDQHYLVCGMRREM
ncbi:MAG: hypothetical protein IPN39_11670 [Chitinophagaceae bacterium]|nr:hypothetical protein [Chitinophagaceae bacterium]